MTRTILKGGIAAAALILALGGLAQARTDAETKAIVLKFNRDAFMGGDKAALPNEMSDDFIEHHPPSGTPERTKAEFLSHFGKPMKRNPSMPMGPPPAPLFTLVSGNYVLLVTVSNMPDPTMPGKTYQADNFDLFRVDDAGKVAEHWDNGTKRAPAPPPP